MTASDKEREITIEEARHYQAPDDAESDFMFARGLRETEEIEERQEAQEHALEYMHECWSLRTQLRDQERNHELELARLETKCQTEMADLKSSMFSIAEMVKYVKERYSPASAKDFVTMCYRLFLQRGDRVDEETVKLLDGIDDAIKHREALHQTIEIPQPGQVYINTHNVHNHEKEEK